MARDPWQRHRVVVVLFPRRGLSAAPGGIGRTGPGKENAGGILSEGVSPLNCDAASLTPRPKLRSAVRAIYVHMPAYVCICVHYGCFAARRGRFAARRGRFAARRGRFAARRGHFAARRGRFAA